MREIESPNPDTNAEATHSRRFLFWPGRTAFHQLPTHNYHNGSEAFEDFRKVTLSVASTWFNSKPNHSPKLSSFLCADKRLNGRAALTAAGDGEWRLWLYKDLASCLLNLVVAITEKLGRNIQ